MDGRFGYFQGLALLASAAGNDSRVCHFLRCKGVEMLLSPRDAETGPWVKYLGANRVPACSPLHCFSAQLKAIAGQGRAGQWEGAGSEDEVKGRGVLQSDPGRVMGCFFLPPKSPGPEW